MSPTIHDVVIPFGGCFDPESENLKDHRLVFVGLPDDSNSSYCFGPAKAPDRIRRAFDGNCYNATTELGVELYRSVTDNGNLPSGQTWQQTAAGYRKHSAVLLESGKVPFFAGGDHAVTVPIVASLAVLGEPVHVIQLDAHPDLYKEFDGSEASHACVGARILEMDHVRSLTQIGIRTLNESQRGLLDEHPQRLRIHFARDCSDRLPKLKHIADGEPVYITLDLDSMDPAYVPGLSHLVPGGLTPRQVINFIHQGHWRLIGMDVVELNPDRDINDQTALVAAKMLHEGMGYVFTQLKS